MARTNYEPARAGGAIRPLRRLLGGSSDAPRIDKITADRAAEIGEATCDIVGAGLGILFAPTRDGGALSIVVLDGDEREKGYASDPDGLTAILAAVRDTATARRLGGPNAAQ